MGGGSRIGALAEAVARGAGAEILKLLREFPGEVPYQRYVDGRRGRHFPEGSIMTRREYERWRIGIQEQRLSEARC